MNNIALIGAGQLGSRHLQALALLDPNRFSIFVCDTNEESLNIARQRFDEVNGNRFNVTYTQQINDLPSDIAVAIIATGSMVRKRICEQLLKEKKVKAIVLEKVLFPSIDDYREISELLSKTNTRAFVNCPRRMWQLYKDIKLQMSGPLNFQVIGNNWGLGSNGIHMLDLFSFLVNDESIQVEGSGVDKIIQKSKRPGYIEFTGRVNGQSKDGSLFTAVSHRESASPVTLFLSNASCRILVKEEGAKATLQMSHVNNQWKWQESTYEIQFQSKLSHLFVENLVQDVDCGLTPYATSANLHTSMLTVFLQLMNESSNEKITLCPIT